VFGVCLFSILLVEIFDQTNSGSSRFLLTEHPNAMKITHLLQNKIYFVVVNERRFKFIQANSQFNPRRFDKP